MAKYNNPSFINIMQGISQTISLFSTIAAFIPRKTPEYAHPPLENTDSMQGLAKKEELENFRYKKLSFYLGRIHQDHGQNYQAGIADDRHIFIAAGNAGGKGRALLIQNALRWDGGFVGLDPKGELASITAMRRGTQKEAEGTGTSVRKFKDQQVAILDPFSQTQGAARIYKKSYNPLFDIDTKKQNVQELIKKLASACIVPEEGKTSHFSDNAETILAGVIEAVLFTSPKENQNLTFIRSLIIKSFDNLLLILQDIDPKQKEGDEWEKRGRIPPHGLAAEAVGILEDMIGSDEASSFKTTLSKNLKWLSEPQIKAHTENSDFSLRELVQNQGSVYIVIPPNRMEEYKGWLRIIIQTCINAKIELGINQTTQQTLFMLDEFPLLGRFKEIESSAGFLRGYNCKLVCVIQNIGQIKNLYSKNWETFLGNAGAIIGFALNDYETEEYLSNRMGKILAWETSFNTNQGASTQGIGGGINEGKGVSQTKNERAVRRPNEIHEQAARHKSRAFVVPADGNPFTIERQNYDNIPASGLYDSPAFCAAWEKSYKGYMP